MIEVNNKQEEGQKKVFPWYEEVPMNSPLSQGDIIFDFPVPVFEEKEEYPFFKALGAEFPVIVMTQACDLEQGKVKEISLCAIEPVENIIKSMMLDEAEKSELDKGIEKEKIERDLLIDFSNLQGKKRKRPRKIIEELKKGQILGFYLLNKNESGSNGTTIDFGFHVVLLKKTYQIPVNSAKKIIESGMLASKSRLRLLPPYREHLAQAYANTYSRIGLPIDIVVDSAEMDVISKFKASSHSTSVS